MIYLLLSLITFSTFAQSNFERVNAEKIVVSSTSQASMPCPAMTQTQRDATTPANGECVYNTTSGKLNTYNGSLWIEVGSGSGGVVDWQTATGYLVGDLVIESNRFYRCLISHTSGTFATDLAAARWILIPSLTKSDVGLGNVDNTSDATKNSAAVALTNKTINADLNTITNIENADIKSGAAIDAAKIADGSVSSSEFQFIGSLTSDAQTQINGKVSGVASSVDSEIMLFDSTTGKASKRATGTGLVKATSGVYSTGTASLTSEVSGVLPLSNGGTNKNTTAVSGAVAYTDSDSFELTAAGSSGNVLKSNGSGAPAFGTVDLSAASNVGSSVLGISNGGTNNSTLSVSAGRIMYGDGTKINSTTSGTSSQVLYGGASPGFAAPQAGYLNLGGSSTLYQSLRTPNFTGTANGATWVLETGNKNILANASFGGGTVDASWTNNGTEVGVVETTVVVDGAQSIAFNPSSETINLVQSSTLYAAQFADGVQCLASVRVKSNLSAGTLSVCAVQAGTVSTTGCVTVNNDNKWGLYKVPFLCGGTSNGISIAGSSLTGTVYVDDAYVGAADALSVQAGSCRDAVCSTEFTALVSSTGVISFENVDWLSSCTNVSGVVTCTYSSTLQASLTQGMICVLNRAGSSGGTVATIGDATTTTGFTSSSGNTTSNPTVVICQKTGADFLKAEQVKSGDVYTSQCGANCVDVFSAKINTADAVSDESVDWIDGDCTNATTGFATCTFKPGIFTVAPNCAVTVLFATGQRGAQITDTTSSSVTFKGFSTGGADVNMAFHLLCQKQGADFTATRLIQGTFKNMSQYPGINRPKTCLYYFGGASATLASPTECTTGTCVEVYDSCGALSPPARSGAGVYTDMTLANGTFANSSPLDCKCEAYDASIDTAKLCRLYFTTGDQTWSTTSSGGAILNLATSDASSSDAYVKVRCTGESP